MVKKNNFHIFFQRGLIQRGESILIHSGAGGVGQAAIRYCLFYGLTVFTTVGNEQRKEFIKKLFPQIPGNTQFKCTSELVRITNKTRTSQIEVPERQWLFLSIKISSTHRSIHLFLTGKGR